MSEQHRQRTSNGRLARVAVNLPPTDWHRHALEIMWAEGLGDDRYRLQNVPFYAYGLSFDDVVVAKDLGGQLIVQNVVERGGHSTYRVFLSGGISIREQKFIDAWTALECIGATFEQATDRLLAVDIPATSDVYAAFEYLSAGERDGVWDFEEGHCGHGVVTQ